MTTGPLESEVIARGAEDELIGMGRKLDPIGDRIKQAFRRVARLQTRSGVVPKL
jgi:hypothetical protein